MSASLLYATKFVAKATASLFTGSVFYCSYAEHPARLKCDSRTALNQWLPSFKRAAVTQVSLVLVCAASSLTTYYYEQDKNWLYAGLLALSILPYTKIFLMPTNWSLLDPNIDPDSPQTKALMEKWGSRHLVRTLIGLAFWTLLNI